MTEENENKALWIFKNFKETIDVMPKKYRGRAWEIIINYAFGEIENISKENSYIQMAVKSLLPLIKLRGKGGSKSGISNNPSGKSKPNMSSDIRANVGANVGATPYITETLTETETKNINNKPKRKEIEEYCKMLGKKIDIDEFIAYYDASDWKDEFGSPIIWKRKVLTFAKNYKPKETTPQRTKKTKEEIAALRQDLLKKGMQEWEADDYIKQVGQWKESEV